MGGFTCILGLKESNQKSSDRYWANFVQNVYDDGVPLSDKKEIYWIFRKVLLQENRLFYPGFGSKTEQGYILSWCWRIIYMIAVSSTIKMRLKTER